MDFPPPVIAFNYTSTPSTMTDAQRFIESARNHLNDVAADIERHFDNVAGQLRDFLSTDIPFAPRLISRPPPPPPPSTYESVVRWVSKHRAVTAAVLAFVVTGSVGSVLYYQHHKLNRKRRAVRSASGARIEVVVIAGAINSPVASSLALDLERRGYIVYAVSSGAADEHFVRSHQRIDFLPLRLDLSDPYTAQDQLAHFRGLLEKEHVAFEEAEPHKLRFKGIVLIPDATSAPAGLIEDVSSEDWSDAINSKLLNTIATTQLFLPLLKEYAGKLLLLTPSVTSSLLLPGHAVESSVNAALSAFMTTLAREVKDSGMSITQFKLGDLEIPALHARQRREGMAVSRHGATPLRKLHDSVFDALATRNPARTWYVGRGSLTYDMIGAVAPSSFVSWMMDLGRRRQQKMDQEHSTLAVEGSTTWERVDKAL